jgi:hypothetical protein
VCVCERDMEESEGRQRELTRCDDKRTTENARMCACGTFRLLLRLASHSRAVRCASVAGVRRWLIPRISVSSSSLQNSGAAAVTTVTAVATVATFAADVAGRKHHGAADDARRDSDGRAAATAPQDTAHDARCDAVARIPAAVSEHTASGAADRSTTHDRRRRGHWQRRRHTGLHDRRSAQHTAAARARHRSCRRRYRGRWCLGCTRCCRRPRRVRHTGPDARRARRRVGVAVCNGRRPRHTASLATRRCSAWTRRCCCSAASD